MTGERFVVVGIGADGWDGLTLPSQRELAAATTIYGSARQLALLSPDVDAELVAWRSPMSAHLREVLDDSASGTVHLLASGDPMFHGLGTTVVEALGRANVRVLAHPSSVSLAAALLGWDLSTVRVVSLVTGDVDDVVGAAGDRRRLMILSRDASSPAAVAAMLRDGGWGASTMTVLEQLGGPAQRVVSGTSAGWDEPHGDPLNIIAIECTGPTRQLAPGLPDAAFTHDGQLTKQAVRALTVAALAPSDGQLLWDIGAGAGSVGIEWLRLNPSGRVVAVERDATRTARIGENARRHGVASRLTVVDGEARTVLAGLHGPPDAVFAGGGLDAEVFRLVWPALARGGIFVANAVAIPTQELVIGLAAEHGGTLRRIGLEEAGPLGSLTAWRPALPVVQWAVRKEGR
ncbi:MAG TPA: precorrin-6y C5,15-methyltransferase (decarboxylating) subunit CbiE [Gordonia sp. (in: high G+C Gram-positive bacteria)]|uniref:precorrin-6y C5,15-methyltransferase (decarboxylating) subunit CbiE n=1 Tax=unclassified Gordonia (in: high G+C Gram-positive bacteria) TaxID=2657482 RepID=UPI000FA45B81|nr:MULTISPECIES: precorrin-6y C5,15-methyltransferase (decarboxylating) subunit CbiE [unclassified Gordonia (in: high G+C Gram-positive bacteria)]RUP38665.1 MAG: precorrin-6y C5,15-methyltransferase (decarboxylating) subunit CbiE [Gordonia sp. (in: high G+C Gram-positive bacteria)]HNP56345.1 precorrin-6y C5,15-methyltransferase (decarboxylating) subunit CbiE [Gordonia sp. (in: high G+C Gram-positive bacteria)]HRC50029.1 precorrin-6y C5,15-methyltransferase (decarboxylating) subunit CbiE [Gordoni